VSRYGRLEPVPEVREVGEKLADDHRVTVDVHLSENRRGARRQRRDERVDPSALGLVRPREAMHHHESARRGYMGEITLHAARGDTLTQLVFCVELVAGHRHDMLVLGRDQGEAVERAGAACRRGNCVV